MRLLSATYICCLSALFSHMSAGCSKAESFRDSAVSQSEPASQTPGFQKDEKKEQTAKKIKDKPVVSPNGTFYEPSQRLWIQTCDDSSPCAALRHDEGMSRCQSLVVEQLSDWELPTKDVLSSLARVKNLEKLSGYHWSSTRYLDDANQFWIVDPSGKSQSTTIPKDRKEFLVRCVQSNNSEK